MRRGGKAKRRPAGSGRVVKIEVGSLGARGDGIAADGDGRTLYIPFALPGERVRARVEEARGDGFAATLIDVLSPSPARIKPVCRHFGTCGGCALQHLDGASYGEWKRGLVVAALQARGFADTPVAPLLAIAPGTRRRARLHGRVGPDGVAVGFFGRASRRIVDQQECPLLVDGLTALVEPLRGLMADMFVSGESAAFDLTLTDSGVDLLIGAAKPLDLAARTALAEFATAHDLARLSWQEGDEEPEPVAQRRAPVLRFAGVAVTPPPGGFLQSSQDGEAALCERVLDGIGAAARVADLYAGCGSFTFPLAQRAQVLAVEGDGDSARALGRAADAAGSGVRVTVTQRDLARRPLQAAELAGFDAVVFDPPRAGAAEQARELAASAVPVVVGVSCNPATFARDARLLAAGGYVLERVTPVDQFAFSPHLELVGVFRRA